MVDLERPSSSVSRHRKQVQDDTRRGTGSSDRILRRQARHGRAYGDASPGHPSHRRFLSDRPEEHYQGVIAGAVKG